METRDANRIAAACAVTLAISFTAMLTGCSHGSDAGSPPPSASVQAVAPNAPLAGVPQDASPEQQAQIEHMRSMGQQGSAPAPTGTGQ